MPRNIETNRERFVRIVERRVNVILNDLDSLGKCSNRKNYDYSEENVKKIFGEIKRKVGTTEAMFKDGTKNRNRFRLKN
ncbi:hypothetical protein KA005_59730 [bacterium]|nr:hypothetical protein [bacterium]